MDLTLEDEIVAQHSPYAFAVQAFQSMEIKRMALAFDGAHVATEKAVLNSSTLTRASVRQVKGTMS